MGKPRNSCSTCYSGRERAIQENKSNPKHSQIRTIGKTYDTPSKTLPFPAGFPHDLSLIYGPAPARDQWVSYEDAKNRESVFAASLNIQYQYPRWQTPTRAATISEMRNPGQPVLLIPGEQDKRGPSHCSRRLRHPCPELSISHLQMASWGKSLESPKDSIKTSGRRNAAHRASRKEYLAPSCYQNGLTCLQLRMN